MKFPTERLKELIEYYQNEFKDRISHIIKQGGITELQYASFLSMQSHLTKGVQKHFYQVASHPSLGHKKSLKKFLVKFADEEEFHYEIALKDLDNLGVNPEKYSLDVELWWAYFDKVVVEKPITRLGATCILENISSSSRDDLKYLLSSAKFLNPRNTRFVVIHQHSELLPHGEEIIEALQSANLDEEMFKDLIMGAEVGGRLYLRMIDEAFFSEPFKGKTLTSKNQ